MPPLRAEERVVAGRYNLIEPIGRGAMGVVWRARDSLLDRDVAIKEVFFKGVISDKDRENAYKRTMREARTAARLSHRGVVTIYDVAEEDGRPWIIMEFVPSRSLEKVLSSDGPLSPRRACRIGQQLLAALAHAHAAGVLHRDVKPGNVLIADESDGDRAVLTDFGIAQFAGDPRLTQTGMVMGSPGFTAPERIRGGTATPASDLWSLGATLFAAVEGHGPYEKRGGAITTMTAIINEDAPPAEAAGPLGPLIAALLHRNPRLRPPAEAAGRMFSGVLPLLPPDPGPERRGSRLTPKAISGPAETDPGSPEEAPAPVSGEVPGTVPGTVPSAVSDAAAKPADTSDDAAAVIDDPADNEDPADSEDLADGDVLADLVRDPAELPSVAEADRAVLADLLSEDVSSEDLAPEFPEDTADEETADDDTTDTADDEAEEAAGEASADATAEEEEDEEEAVADASAADEAPEDAAPPETPETPEEPEALETPETPGSPDAPDEGDIPTVDTPTADVLARIGAAETETADPAEDAPGEPSEDADTPEADAEEGAAEEAPPAEPEEEAPLVKDDDLPEKKPVPSFRIAHALTEEPPTMVANGPPAITEDIRRPAAARPPAFVPSDEMPTRPQPRPQPQPAGILPLASAPPRRRARQAIIAVALLVILIVIGAAVALITSHGASAAPFPQGQGLTLFDQVLQTFQPVTN